MMADTKYYIEYGFINDYGEERMDDIGKTIGFTAYEAIKIADDLKYTDVCTVLWTEIKELK